MAVNDGDPRRRSKDPGDLGTEQKVAEILQRPYHRIVSGEPAEGYLGEVLELEGCITAGATPEEALRNLDEAMAVWVDSALAEGDPIPEPAAGPLRPSAHFITTTTARLTRELEVFEGEAVVGTIRVEISMPVQSNKNPWDWQCELVVFGADYSQPMTIYGGDGVSAVQLALGVAEGYFQGYSRDHDVRWFGSRDLGFSVYRLFKDSDGNPT